MIYNCPRCLGKLFKADEEGCYWFSCRECGYNTAVSYDWDSLIEGYDLKEYEEEEDDEEI